MKIAKKKVKMTTPLVNPIIHLERPLENILKKGEYIAIKCHNTPGESIEAHRPNRKYCILHGKCSHSIDNCKDLRAIVKKYKQKQKKPFKNYGKNNKELKALIEK